MVDAHAKGDGLPLLSGLGLGSDEIPLLIAICIIEVILFAWKLEVFLF
jgi:hypothetical protein